MKGCDIMSINPEQKPYLKLTPLRMQCLTNFPFIEADFDALTDYQLFCEIVKYLNNVIKNENIVTDNVIALYDAFMQLQEEVESELAEQNQRIDDYFENTNIQAFVDNKINEMIATNEFQTLLIDAINEINPDALKNEKRINNLNFGGTLIEADSLEDIDDSLFLSSTMKPIIINILNNMRDNNELYYYFTNGDEDANNMKLFKFDISNVENGSIYLYVYYLINYLELDNPTVLWKQDFNITISDNIITDISIDNDNKTTRTLYTGSGGGSTETPIYYITDATSNPNFLIGSFTMSNVDKFKYINIFMDAVTKNYKGIIVYLLTTAGTQNLLYFDLSSVNLSAYYSNIKVGQFYNSMLAGSISALVYNGSTTKAYNYIQLQLSIASGVITDITYLSGHQAIDKYLGVNNDSAYTPTENTYQPATAKYVEYIGRMNATEIFNSLHILADYVNYLNGYTSNDLTFIRQGDIYQLKAQLTNSSLTSGGVYVLNFPIKYGLYTINATNQIGTNGVCLIDTGSTFLLAPYVFFSDYVDNEYVWKLYVDIPSGATASSTINIDIMWIHNKSND